jgi:hypothetical protein
MGRGESIVPRGSVVRSLPWSLLLLRRNNRGNNKVLQVEYPPVTPMGFTPRDCNDSVSQCEDVEDPRCRVDAGVGTDSDIVIDGGTGGGPQCLARNPVTVSGCSVWIDVDGMVTNLDTCINPCEENNNLNGIFRLLGIAPGQEEIDGCGWIVSASTILVREFILLPRDSIILSWGSRDEIVRDEEDVYEYVCAMNIFSVNPDVSYELLEVCSDEPFLCKAEVFGLRLGDILQIGSGVLVCDNRICWEKYQ